MAAIVTERFSDQRMSFAYPWTATRVFEVSGVTTEPDALNATGIPQARQAHPRNTALICKGPSIREAKGPDYWLVQADYDFQGGPIAGEVDPLSLPTQFSWNTIELSEESDTDASGRVICNSAGDVGALPQPYTLKGLSARKAFTLVDASWFTLENTVNSGAINIDGITVAAEHMLCKSCNPEPYYKNAYTYVWVVWQFEICLTTLLGQSKYPFTHRVLDAGRNGWWSNSGTPNKGSFVFGTTPVDFDVRLNGSGLPNSDFSYIKVGDGNGAAKTAGSPPSSYPCYSSDTVGNSVWRYFEKYPKANHATLPIW